MRQTGTLIKRYAGDEEAAKQYLGIARTLLGRMKATLAGASGSRLWVLPNGTTVRTAAGPHGDIVEITAKVPAPAPEEMLSGLVCIPMSDDADEGWGTPEDEDHPIGTPGGPKPQFFLRANREGGFAPEFRVKRHTEFKAGNINWTNASHTRRLSFHGPRSRYFLDGYGDGDAYNYAAVYANGKEIDLSGFFNRVVGAAMRGNVLLVMVTDYAGKYRLGYKFPGEAFALAESYSPPSRAPNADYIPWTIAPFNQSATKCSFVMNTPLFGGGHQDTILVEGTISIDTLTKEAHIVYETSAPGRLTRVAQGDTINLSGTHSSETIAGDTFVRVIGDDTFTTSNAATLFAPEGEASSTYLCVDYEGDTRLVGEIKRTLAAASGGGSGGSNQHVDLLDSNPPGEVREVTYSRSGGGSYSSSTNFEFEHQLCINGAPVLLLERLTQSGDVSGSSSESVFHKTVDGVVTANTDIFSASHTLGSSVDSLLLRFTSHPTEADGVGANVWRLKYVDLRQILVYMMRLYSSQAMTSSINKSAVNGADSGSTRSTTHADHRFIREELFFQGMLTTLSEVEISDETTTTENSGDDVPLLVQVTDQFGPLFFQSSAVYTNIVGDYVVTREQPGGGQDINPSEFLPPTGTAQQMFIHAPVQRRNGQPAVFMSARNEIDASLPRHFHNKLFLDGALRDPVSIFDLVGANPRFADIASF